MVTTQTTTLLYYIKNGEVKRSCRRDKNGRIDRIDCELEKAEEIKTCLLSGKRNIERKPFKDMNGVVLTMTQDQLNWWKEHFRETIIRPENPLELPKGPPFDIRTGPITMAEINRLLRTWTIPPELGKSGSLERCSTLFGIRYGLSKAFSMTGIWVLY